MLALGPDHNRFRLYFNFVVATAVNKEGFATFFCYVDGGLTPLDGIGCKVVTFLREGKPQSIHSGHDEVATVAICMVAIHKITIRMVAIRKNNVQIVARQQLRQRSKVRNAIDDGVWFVDNLTS